MPILVLKIIIVEIQQFSCIVIYFPFLLTFLKSSNLVQIPPFAKNRGCTFDGDNKNNHMAIKHKYGQIFPTEKISHELVSVLTNTAYIKLVCHHVFQKQRTATLFGGQWEFGEVTLSAWDPKQPSLSNWNKSSSLKLMKQCEVWGLRLLLGSAGSMQIRNKLSCLIIQTNTASDFYLFSCRHTVWVN